MKYNDYYKLNQPQEPLSIDSRADHLGIESVDHGSNQPVSWSWWSLLGWSSGTGSSSVAAVVRTIMHV